jgi:RNA polymerase sigma-70 factor (ECF subfamily)
VDKPLGHSKKEFLLSLRRAIEACARKNSNKAKEFIYKQYYGYIMAVVLRYVKDSHDAEELVNECFIRVFKNMDRFKMNGEMDSLEKLFLGWMARISSNLSIDHLRAKKQVVLIDDHQQFEAFVSPSKPSVNLEVDDILKLLDTLPEVQRLIFNLFEVEGYSHEEIGLKLGIPESTSRTYLTRAKKKLRELYLIMNDN